MKPSLALSLIPVLAAALASCKPKPPAGAMPPLMAMTPEVTTHTVAPQRIELTTELPGRAAPFLIAEIRPQVSGLVQKRLFEEGSDVKAGQVLYQIDPAPFEATLNNAKAALGRAEATLPALRLRAERFQQALADKAVAQQDFDDADAALRQGEAEVESLKAMVEVARINLGYAKVVSPIAGRIGKSSVTDGAIVTAYQPTALATIQQLDPVYVDVHQSTNEMMRLKRRLQEGSLTRAGTSANKVQLILGDGTQYALEGTLQFSDVSVDPTTGMVTLRMVFPNPAGVLLPGMFVRAVVNEGANDKAILVPQQSVLRDPKGNAWTYLVDNESKVQRRPLTVERTFGDQWLVTSGLAPGDRVVVTGIQSLQRAQPGVVVKEVPPGADQAPAGQPPAQGPAGQPPGAARPAPATH